MIVVDTSVWIDHFRGISTPQTSILEALLPEEAVATGDLILTEILRGIRSEALFKKTKYLLLSLSVYEMLDVHRAVQAANNYRKLRAKGITIRNTVDVLIAGYCIDEGHTLLFSDKDFLPFVEHFGLKTI